jgi:TM2 domain-containing membrane protein YozV
MKMRCPYCGEEMIKGETRSIYCCTCGTAHHPDCWQENGGCTVYGCASAPSEEPKIAVAQADFQNPGQLAPVPAPYAGRPAAPPPPRPPVPRQPTFSLGGYNVAPPQAYNTQAYNQQAYYPPPAYYQQQLGPPKSRVGFVMLGVFLGIFGVHNFYAGYKGKAVTQLCLTVFSLFAFAIVSGIWAIVEVCTVERDAHGILMD